MCAGFCEHCGCGPTCGVCGRDETGPQVAAVAGPTRLEQALDEVMGGRYALEAGQYTTARECFGRAEWELRAAGVRLAADRGPARR